MNFKRTLFWVLTGLNLLVIQSCTAQTPSSEQIRKPNILWITFEDISPHLSMYGDSTAQTPVFDKMAEESMVFANAFTTVGVCAPSRSSIITGMHPVSIGTQHMRTGKDVMGWGRREYEQNTNRRDIEGNMVPRYSAVIPPQVRPFTEYLRAEGYYTTNNPKTDYQFAAPVTAWDENGRDAHWSGRAQGQPFFSVFNLNVTHESRIWKNKDLPLTVDPDSVPLPAYFPDNPVVRRDVARQYSNIELLDQQVGEILNELQEDGLLDETIIFFYSDHGGALPRGKRDIHDSGLKVPFMIRFPDGRQTGFTDELISFVDLAPTTLSLAGIKPPEYMQGHAFLGQYKVSDPRSYVYGSSDRFDEVTDMRRAVRDKRFLYIRNFYPSLPAYKDLSYRKQVPMMKTLLELRQEDQLTEYERRWFESPKAEEELYDTKTDPDNIHNLADDASYSEKLSELRNELEDWQKRIGDKGFIPETEMLENMWPEGQQPETNKPVFKQEGNKITLSSSTKGAEIAFIVSDKELNPTLDSGWKLYTEPFELSEGDIVYAIANRIGYRDSKIVEFDYE
ncbi:sulfatase-like hydrolase/transferase [Balneolaceae bacterium YR4-1]|uniref:Sulfatase-like hydrolase/transferase n=1 Tax=Halalkalibaculum roseum TaxID=2709311 RepID=A0A6M1T1V0_9BACT|nr:sulfatase-like hydrolase/transferase [Halalkalibaculum roseum]NGP78096.1 sulfatase-like hydrolase/transferase [Halalkalibaculum roseum]